jgi:hypothetical protein
LELTFLDDYFTSHVRMDRVFDSSIERLNDNHPEAKVQSRDKPVEEWTESIFVSLSESQSR